MKTVLIELRNNNALKILEDLELANVIRILDLDNNKEEVKEPTKLSTRLRGAISKERAKELSEQLSQMRNEWESRDI